MIRSLTFISISTNQTTYYTLIRLLSFFVSFQGLQTDVCEWLFECPSGFQCVSSKGNATCTSVCHSEYCKHQGICVHRLGQQPICQ